MQAECSSRSARHAAYKDSPPREDQSGLDRFCWQLFAARQFSLALSCSLPTAAGAGLADDSDGDPLGESRFRLYTSEDTACC